MPPSPLEEVLALQTRDVGSCGSPRDAMPSPKNGDSPEAKKKRSASPLVAQLAVLVMVTLTMSFWGLIFRWKFRSSFAGFLLDAFSVSLENTFLLATGHYLFSLARSPERALWARLSACLCLVSLSCLAFLFAVGDYGYQMKTRGRIVADVLIASTLNDLGSFTSEVNNNYWDTLTVVSRVGLSYAYGILLYAYLECKVKAGGGGGISFGNLLVRSQRNYWCIVVLMVGAQSIGGYGVGNTQVKGWSPSAHVVVSVAKVRGYDCWTRGWCSLRPTFTAEDLRARAMRRKEAFNVTMTSRPNIVLVVHESTSQSLMDTRQARQAMPFWNKEMRENESVFQFRNAFTTAGNTVIATPAILTGLNSYTKKGMDMVLTTSLAMELRAQGYETVMFSSYATDLSGTYWKEITPLLREDFDTVVDCKSYPKETGWSFRTWGGALDDRFLMAKYRSWLGSRDSTAPLFSVIIWNNQHYPFLAKDKRASRTELDRYVSSLSTTDETFRDLFSILEDRNATESTVVMGAGDHGETPGVLWRRMTSLEEVTMKVPLWMVVPRALLPDPEDRKRLRRLQDHPVLTLDIVPTLRHLVGLGGYLEEEVGEVLVGRNLLARSEDARDHGKDYRVAWYGGPFGGDGARRMGLLPNIASIIERNEALLIQEDKSKSKRILFKRDAENPMSRSHEDGIGNLSRDERIKWWKVLKEMQLQAFVTSKIGDIKRLLKL